VSPKENNQFDDVPVFPILRGESVGEAGEFSGLVVLIEEPGQIKREWSKDSIAVLHLGLEQHFIDNPGDLDNLMSEVSAVLAEFGDSVSEFAAVAYHHETVAVVKVADACHVLEEGMYIRIVGRENIGDIFFID